MYPVEISYLISSRMDVHGLQIHRNSAVPSVVEPVILFVNLGESFAPFWIIGSA